MEATVDAVSPSTAPSVLDICVLVRVISLRRADYTVLRQFLTKTSEQPAQVICLVTRCMFAIFFARQPHAVTVVGPISVVKM